MGQTGGTFWKFKKIDERNNVFATRMQRFWVYERL